MTAAPGGPVQVLAFGPKVSPQQRERLAAQLGVNDPWIVQYLRWLLGDDWLRWDSNGDGISDHSFLISLDANNDGEPDDPGVRKGVLRGDFGDSFFARRPALDLIFERIPATVELGLTSLTLGILIGVPVGILAAVRRGGLFDNTTRIVAVVFNAIPVFWLGLVLILIFGSVLGILPMGGRCPPSLTIGCPPLYQRLSYLILPTFVLATGEVAGYSRYMRGSMLDIIGQDYVRTAKSKGLSMRTVWFKHGARNALIPLATFLGPSVAGILGGAPITETIFSWPGLGRLGVTSVFQQDYPVIMAVTIFAAVATILGFMLSDVLYALVDPRIRFS
jgi:peptide/nickel transport system permease protein